jgi:hypothetical protein
MSDSIPFSIGQGAYSADRICEGRPIRPPFEHGGTLWVTVSISGGGLTATGEIEMKAYRLVPEAMFKGTPTTYAQKVIPDHGDAARADPLGFYDAMKVVCGGKPFVLKGPPATFTAAAEAVRPAEQPEVEQQMSLFL